MRGFFLGIIFTLLVLIVGGWLYSRSGRLNFEADQRPSDMERRFALGAVDASIEHRAPDVKDPLPVTDENILAGAHIYANNCAGCHGTPSNSESPFGASFYPPVPQFFKRAPDMPDNQNFYIVQHGVRWSGMPAWNKTLSEQQMWQVVTFLGNVERLSPAAKQVVDQLAAPSKPAR
jgi:thiosulfate dehydrogenase